jgi:hypothetical protein
VDSLASSTCSRLATTSSARSTLVRYIFASSGIRASSCRARLSFFSCLPLALASSAARSCSISASALASTAGRRPRLRTLAASASSRLKSAPDSAALAARSS